MKLSSIEAPPMAMMTNMIVTLLVTIITFICSLSFSYYPSFTSASLVASSAVPTLTEPIPSTIVEFAPEEPGTTIWFSGSPTGDVSTYTAVWTRSQTAFGNNMIFACTDDWSGRDLQLIGVKFAICWISDEFTYFRAVFLSDMSALDGNPDRVPGVMGAQAVFNNPSPGNTMFFRPDGSIIMLLKDQGYISMFLFLAVGYGHPIIGGLENAGTTPIDGDKTVAVLPNMNGGCSIDMNSFIVLDGHAIRLVDTSVDIDLPTISLYSGSYTQSGVINGDLLTARFTSPSSCQWSKSTNQLYVVEPSTSTLRRIDMNHGQVYALSSTTSGYVDGPILSSSYQNPTSLAIDDDAQILYVSDTGNNVIRQIDLKDGTVDLLAGDSDMAGTIDAVGWDAQFYAPGGISKALDHLYVYEPSLYRMRRVALPIEFAKPLPYLAVNLPFYGDEAKNFTVTITRGCHYDMTATITTSGAMLVNGGHTAVLTIHAGSTTSVPYLLYHPRDSTRSEWVNITMSGACVDAGHFTRVKTQSRRQDIIPPSVMALADYVPSVGGSGSYQVPFYIHPSPSSSTEYFNWTINNPDGRFTVPITTIEVTDNAVFAPLLPVTVTAVGNAMSLGANYLTWSTSRLDAPPTEYEALPITGLNFDVKPLYFSVVASTMTPTVVPWGALAQVSVGFQGYPVDSFTIQAYCNGCGHFNPVPFVAGGTATVMVFTACHGCASGVYPVYFNATGPGARYLGPFPKFSVTIGAAAITLPPLLTTTTGSVALMWNTTYTPLTWSIPNGAVSTDPSILMLHCDCLEPNQQNWTIPGYYANAYFASIHTTSVIGTYQMSYTLVNPNVAGVQPLPSTTVTIYNAVSITPEITSAVIGVPITLTVTMIPPLQMGDDDVTVSLFSNDGAFAIVPATITFTAANPSAQLISVTAQSSFTNGTYNITTSLSTTQSNLIIFPVGGIIPVLVSTSVTPVQISYQYMSSAAYQESTALYLSVVVPPPRATLTITAYLITFPQRTYTTSPGVPTFTVSPQCVSTASCRSSFIIDPIMGYDGEAILALDIQGADANLYATPPFHFKFNRGFIASYNWGHSETAIYRPGRTGLYWGWNGEGINAPTTVTCTASPEGQLVFSTWRSTVTNNQMVYAAWDISPSARTGTVIVDCSNITGTTAVNMTIIPPTFRVLIKSQYAMRQDSWPAVVIPGGIYDHTFYANASYTMPEGVGFQMYTYGCGSFEPQYAPFGDALNTTTTLTALISVTPGQTCDINYYVYDDGTYLPVPTDTITWGSGLWVYPATLTTSINEPRTVIFGIGPYPTGADTLDVELYDASGLLTITPAAFTYDVTTTQVSVTIDAKSSSIPFGDYVIETRITGGSLTATHSVITTLTYTLAKASVSLPAALTSLTLVGGGVYGPFAISLPAPPPQGVSIQLSSAGCTFTPSVLVYTPTDSSLAVTVQTSIPFFNGPTEIDYYITGTDAANYNVPDTTWLTAVTQGFLNFTGYPLPSGMLEGDRVKVKIIPSRLLTETFDTIIITPSSIDNAFKFEPSPFVIRAGMPYRRMRITAIATVTGSYAINWTISGTNGGEYSYIHQSPSIPILCRGRIRFTDLPSAGVPIMAGVRSLVTASIYNRVLSTNTVGDAINITYVPTSLGFTFSPASLTFTPGVTSLGFSMIARSNVINGASYDITWSISNINPISMSSLWIAPSVPLTYQTIGAGSVYMDLPATFLPSLTQLVTVRLTRPPPVAIIITPTNGFGSLPTGLIFNPSSLTFISNGPLVQYFNVTGTSALSSLPSLVSLDITGTNADSYTSFYITPGSITIGTLQPIMVSGMAGSISENINTNGNGVVLMSGSTILSFIINIQLSSLPQIDDIRVNLSLPNCIMTLQDGITLPSVTFTPLSSSTIASINVRITASTVMTPVISTIQAIIIGTNVLAYDVPIMNITKVQVTPYIDVPSLTSLRFNPSGTRIIAMWDRATNTPGVPSTTGGEWPRPIDCSLIINQTSFPSLGLPTGADAIIGVCVWSSATTLEVILGSSSTIMVGNTIAFRSNVLTTKGQDTSGNYWSPAASGVAVTAPLSLTLPTVTLVTVNEVGVCSDLVLDGRQVIGLSRPSMAIYNWNLTSSTSMSISSLVAIRSLLQSSTTQALVTISSSMLTAGDSYTFTVSVTNFLGATSMVSARVVKKLSYGIPILTISGASSIARTSSIPLTLIPALSFPLAGCITLTGTWTYKWFISSIDKPSSSVTPLIPSFTVSSRNLVVAAKAMSSDCTYTFGVNATSVTDGTIVTAVYSTYILPSLVIAIINGGNQFVSPSVTLTLDGSRSYDASSSSSTGLSYLWSCTMPSTGASCALGSTVLTSSIITVQSSNLLPLSTYQFTLTVTSTIDGRSSSTSVIIKTDAAAVSVTVPIINVGISPSSSVVLYNGNIVSSDAILRLIASVSVVQGSLSGLSLSYNWIEVNNMIDMTKRTSVANSASFVLPSGVLSNGASYTLRCTVTATNSITGVVMAISYGEYSIRTSLPPLSSSSNPITITPSTGGIALSTVFTVSLNGFSGELDPFTYSFKQIDRNTGRETIMGDNVQVSTSSISARLPAGDLTIIGMIINQAGQRSSVMTNVTVLPDPSISGTTGGSTSTGVIDYVNNITSTLLNDQLLTGDTSGVLTTIQILTDLLNTANTTTNSTQQIRDQFLQIISDSITTGTPEQIATTLESVTQQQLVNTSISLTLDVAKQLLDRLRDIANGNDGTNHDDITNTTQTSIVSTISNVITSATECTAIARSSSLLTSSINIALSDTIEGESSSVITSSSGDVSVVGSRTSSRATSPTILTLGGNNVVISPEATSDDNDYTSDDTSIDESNPTDVHIITYQPSSTLLQCYNTTANQTSTSVNDTLLPIDVPISPIVSITIQKNGSEVSVSNLSQPILFGNTIPTPIDVINLFGSSDRCSQRQPTCSWFDHSTNTWSSEGCTTVTVAAANGGSGSTVQCSCNHLTEFAILARESANSCNGIVIYDDEKLVYGIFAIAYAVVAFVSLVQISRVVYYTRTKCKLDLLAAEHVCVFIIAIIRGFLLLIRGQFSWSGLDLTSMSMVELGLLTAVPYLFQFLAYTFLVATWASVYHFAMEKRGQSPFAKLKVPFIITNTIIGLTVFGLFGAIGGVDADMGKTLAMIGTIIMAVLTFIMVIAYLVYGRALINTLTKTGGGTASKSPVVRNLYYATGAFCICFLAEATIWVVSAVILDDLYEDAAGILGAYYGVNWLSLVIILGMFRQGVNKLSPSYNRSTAGSNAGSSRTLKSQTSKGQLSSRNLTSDDGNKKTNASNHARGASNGGIGVSDDTDFGIELATVTPTSAPSSPVAGSGRGMVQHNRQLSKHNDLNGDSDAEFVSNV